MTPSKLEKSILALLKTNHSMKYQDIKSCFKLSIGGMNKISHRLRHNKLVVSVSEGSIKLWYDKEYADSQGIKPSEFISGKWSHTDIFEQPYIDRLNRINSLWRIAV